MAEFLKIRGRDRRARTYFVPIVLVALLLRVGAILLTEKAHPAQWFFGQASELGNVAESLRTGHGWSSPFRGADGPSAFLSPGYPLLIAAVFAIFGAFTQASATVTMLLQATFGVLTVLGIMVFTRECFGRRASMVSGFLWAVAPPVVYLPTIFWETSLSALLLMLLVGFTRRLAAQTTRGTWLAWAGLAATAVAVNPALLTVVASCWGWTLWQAKADREARKRLLLALALCVLFCTPWAVRNAVQLHAFVPLRDNFGYEVWQGNRPGADGFFDPALHPNVNEEELSAYRSHGETGYMRMKSAAAESAIRASPGRFAVLSAKRLFLFWSGFGKHASALIVAHIAFTTLVGGAGLLLLWRRRRDLALYMLLPLILFPLPYYITHPDFRFRLVLDPLMSALASYALTQWKHDDGEFLVDAEHVA